MTKKKLFRFKEWALPLFDSICKHSRLKSLFWLKTLGYTIFLLNYNISSNMKYFNEKALH